MNEKEERERLERFIEEDNVDELSKILNSNHNFRNFNYKYRYQLPLLLFAVKTNCQKVVEYLLSQVFIDKTICDTTGGNIYHVICRIRGAEELFSIIERKVPHHLLLDKILGGMNAFDIACKKNNVFIVKRAHEILETLQFDLTSIKRNAIYYAIENDDIEVIKYVLSIDGIQLDTSILGRAIENFKFDIVELNIEVVVYLLNIYLCQSIPSHLHNQFHIFQFSILYSNHNDNICKNNDYICKGNDDDNYYLKMVEENYKRIMEMEYYGNRIWYVVCRNVNLDVVQLIFSLKRIQPEIPKLNGNNVFLIVCNYNSNIKVIKYIHKLFPSLINSQLIYGGVQNGAHLLISNTNLNKSDKLNILHYLYLNGIDIHLISNVKYSVCRSIYWKSVVHDNDDDFYDKNIDQYLQVISQDFDYLHNEHDHESYRKPSFWKEIDHRKNVDEQSIRINEWKNRFEEHVLHHLSKMIQQHILELN